MVELITGDFVAFDIPTLTFAVLLVMSVSSLALVVHWLVNRTIGGTKEIALGVVAFSVGNCFIVENLLAAGASLLLLGQALMLMGHFWIWLGISSFWHNSHQKLVLFAGLIVASAIIMMSYQAYNDVPLAGRLVTSSLFIAALSLGIVRTLVHAIGGGAGLYKGIVRRTTVGAGVAAALFFSHAVYQLFQSFSAVPAGGKAQAIIIAMQLETLVFIILLALVVVIMTAERLKAELRIQEMMDPLTKALNRRAFLEVMKAVLARARRLAEPVSLVMIDIDKFKKVNQAHGRIIGDLALAEFAALVMTGRRSQDVFCRFGGEEFVLMLPGTPEEGADLVAERIRSKIEQASITPNGISIKLTVCMGVVTARGDDLDADGMLDVVDRRMLHAQRLMFQTIETAG